MKQKTNTATIFLVIALLAYLAFNAYSSIQQGKDISSLKESNEYLSSELESKQNQINQLNDKIKVANARALYKEKDFQFIFTDNAKESIRNNFITDYPKETAVCLYGSYDSPTLTYNIEEVKRANILFHNETNVRFICEPYKNYLFDAHSHPEGYCTPSDVVDYASQVSSNNAVQGIICDIDNLKMNIFDIKGNLLHTEEIG